MQVLQHLEHLTLGGLGPNDVHHGCIHLRDSQQRTKGTLPMHELTELRTELKLDHVHHVEVGDVEHF